MTVNINSIDDRHALELAASAIAKRTTKTVEQLRLLGYTDGELVYYRAIADNKPRKLQANFPDIPSKLGELNESGFNIYLVVNGGGDKDVDVITCKAIFYEHDDLPKEDQLYLWNTLQLPEPTFQVDTGGKSIHSYWVFDRPLDVSAWRVIQRDLLNYSDADRTIKNPSRVMRLAGFKHQGTEEISKIVSRSAKTYTFETLRSAIPVEAPKPEKISKPKAERVIKPRTEPTPARAEAIPLENCLAKSNRDLLCGVSEPGRNVAGATLARDLIGTANYMGSLCTTYIGSARSLFNDFCQRCNPSIDETEAQTIWSSAEADLPDPSCPPDAITNILNAFYRDNDPDYVELQEERKLGYYSNPDEGLVSVHMGKNADGEPSKVKSKVGNHLVAIAVVDNPDQTQSSLLLEFKTFQGHIRKDAILRSDLAGDGTAIVATLLGRGYSFKRKQKGQLLDYLHGLGIGISKKYIVTDTTGWVIKSFVMPHKTYGDFDLRFHDVDPSPDVLTELRGSIEDWKHDVGTKCAGNSRLIFAIGVAFAAPLLAVTGMESGGFHFVGGTRACHQLGKLR